MRGFFWSSRFDPGQNITWQVRLELQVLQVRRQAQQRVQQVQRLLFYRKRPKQLQR